MIGRSHPDPHMEHAFPDPPEPGQPRTAVRAFSLLMEQVLRENDHKGGWQSCTLDYLLRRLGEEVAELREAVYARGDVGHEAADVANFAMMIADLRGYLAIEAEAAASPPDGWIEGKPLSAAPLGGLWPGALERLLRLIEPEYESDSLVGLAIKDVRSLVEALARSEPLDVCECGQGCVMPHQHYDKAALVRSEGTTGPLPQPVAPGLDVAGLRSAAFNLVDSLMVDRTKEKVVGLTAAILWYDEVQRILQDASLSGQPDQ